jgi:hypothetical protein
VLACAGLSACRTNVGVAAKVDGHTIGESQLSKYLTAKAQSVQQQSGPATPSKSFVLAALINDRLVKDLYRLGRLGPAPSDAAVDADVATVIGSDSPQKFAESHGIKGYTAAFDQLWLRVALRIERVKQDSSNKKVSLLTVLRRTKVSVNPRYGAWDRTAFALKSGPDDGIPSVLKPSASSAAGAAPTQ